MKIRAAIVPAVASGMSMLSACSNELVVVLPASDNHIGGLVVRTAHGQFLLNTPYAEAAPGIGGLKPGQGDPREVTQVFGAALAAQPIPPKNYTLYFVNDSDELTSGSRANFEEVFAEISRRKAAEIVITGHTDTSGTPQYNDQLSLDRANSVEKLFIARGLSGASIITAGRGERELLVKTPDLTHEPLNRRVVITVR
jgi:outer membrane protein OmpA-like peptidoglycan-associated protein